MVRRQRSQTRGQIAGSRRPSLRCRGAGNSPGSVDPGAAIGRIDHQLQGAAGLEHLAQARSPASGSGRWCSTPVQTMCSKLRPSSAARSTGSWRTSRLSRPYLRFSASVQRDARRADVDADHLGARPAQRVLGGLRRAAAGDQDAPVVAIGFVRPEQVGLGAPPVVIPSCPVALQIVDRRRIGMASRKRRSPPAPLGRRPNRGRFVDPSSMAHARWSSKALGTVPPALALPAAQLLP